MMNLYEAGVLIEHIRQYWSQWCFPNGSLRDNLYHLTTRSNVDSQTPLVSGGTNSNQMPLAGQQCYPSCWLRRKGRNGDRGEGDPLDNGRHYSHRHDCRCWGAHCTSGGHDGGPPDDLYGGCTDSFSSSEFGRWHRHDHHTEQHEQFEQGMTAMNNLLIDLLHCQKRTQKETTHTWQVIHQSQQDHVNDCLLNDIPTFDGKPELYLDWILKHENIAAVSKWNPKVAALEKAQGAVIQCLKLLPADVSLNNVKAILRQQFSLVPTVTHGSTGSTWLMYRYQQKEESLLEFIFKFCELIQAVTNCEPKDITDPVKHLMYVQKLCKPAISSKTIWHVYLTLQKARLCTENWVWHHNVSWYNCWKWPNETVQVSNYKCGQKGWYGKDCPNSTGTGPVPDQILTYSPLTTVTASYAAP